MNNLLKFLNKYWVIVAACATLLSTGTGIAFHLKGLIDQNVATINKLNTWVAEHDDDISDLHDDVNKLKEDERLKEQGLCK